VENSTNMKRAADAARVVSGLEVNFHTNRKNIFNLLKYIIVSGII
jgi:hypothetical protein